jgi:hypothetical protein
VFEVGDVSGGAAGLEGIRTCELPPEGFDPITAPPELLRRYGLPRRPDPETEPELARLFRRAFSRPRNFVKPELVVDPELDRLVARRRTRSEFSSGNWGGVVVSTPSDAPPTVALGQFAVPQVLCCDPEGGDELIVGFWVGVGGANGVGSLLQAGIAATVKPNNYVFEPRFVSVSYWAWTEWVPAGYKVANFEVSSGDVVSVLVCGGGINESLVMLENLRTDQVMSIPMSPPGNVPATGPSAEWIVEAISEDVPIFSPVTFFNCIAESQNATLTLTGATTLDMPNNEVNTMIISPSSLTIQWEAFQ